MEASNDGSSFAHCASIRFSSGCAPSTSILIYFFAPLVSRNSLVISTMFFPFHCSTRRGSSVTSATFTAFRFSSSASVRNASRSSLATTTAILSWDSEIASSVPSNPSYFFGTAFKSTRRPSANSPIATETPPAPKSLQRLIMRLACGLRNNLCSFLSSGALPFCTSAPHVSTEWESCALEEPVAPPIPSRPVAPPNKITTSVGAGRSLRTFSAGAAAITAPTSICLAA